MKCTKINKLRNFGCLFNGFYPGPPIYLYYSYFKLFHAAFKLILNQLTPLEQKIVRSNNQPVTSKFFPKAVMKWPKLKNNFNNERNIENSSEYKCQRNYCANVLNQSQSDTLFNLAIQDSFLLNGEFWVL